jgi:hypothetical protein
VIAPAPRPELNLEPFTDTQTQRLAAWQAVGMAQQILPERASMSRKWEAPVLGYYSWGWRGPCTACTDPYLLPYPSHGLPQEPGISLPCSWSGFSMAANLSGQAGRWAMSSPFLCCKFLSRRRPLGLHLSCSRLRCRDWSVPRTVPFATSLGQSLCASHRASTQQRHAPTSFPPGSQGTGALDTSVPRL